MGFWATLTGRAKAQPAVIEPFFALQLAASTLTAECGFTPAGIASICFQAPVGATFNAALHNVRVWLDRDAGMVPAEITNDPYGFTWIVVRRPLGQFQSLVADVHTASMELAPLADQTRDNDLELRVRDVVNGELPVERDLRNWFPVWDAPGL